MQIPDQNDWPIAREIYEERDRGAAVIAAGFLDAKLTAAVRGRLRQDDKDALKRMFKPSGALGGFANKAQLGYLLQLYSKETLADFLLIADIRNRFAHTADSINFGTVYVREQCEKLTLFRRIWSGFPDIEFAPYPLNAVSARKEYLECAFTAANFLHSQAKHIDQGKPGLTYPPF